MILVPPLPVRLFAAAIHLYSEPDKWIYKTKITATSSMEYVVSTVFLFVLFSIFKSIIVNSDNKMVTILERPITDSLMKHLSVIGR